MGEAKNRGPRAQRVAAAQQRTALQDSYARLRPASIRCNGCQAELSQLDAMDVSALRGIEVAFRGHCTPCDQDTWAVRGEPAAVRAFYSALEKAGGGKVQLGTQAGAATGDGDGTSTPVRTAATATASESTGAASAS